MSRLAELGREGILAAVRRLHERRPARLLAQRGGRRPAAAPRLRSLHGPDRGDLLRVQRPPRAAGDGRRGGARAQGLAGRPVDAQERQHRPLARHRPGAGGPADPAARARRLARREAGRDLDRVAGRAAQRAAPDGPPRPSRRRAAAGGHGGVLRHADPRQRAGGQRDDRPAVPHRVQRHHDARRADPRLRPRLRGGDQAHAEPHAAALRVPVPRRPQADPPALARWPTRSASPTSGSSAARTGCRSTSTATARASARRSSPG